MAYLDLVSELTGSLPGLSPLLAEKFITRAWNDIQRERRWSFNLVDGSVVCPAMITTGTFNVVQFQTTVEASTEASAALLPYVTGTPLLTQLSIRFGGSSTLTAGQVYRIMAVDATDPTGLILTLDRMVVEPTNAVATYQCYRSYITPPQENFLAWDSIVDMTYGYVIRLNWTSTYFDMMDPQRTSQGQAYYCGIFRAAGPYGNDTPDANQAQGAPIYELWPAPTQGQTFYVRFEQRGWDLSSPFSVQTPGIDDQVILQRAYGWYAYPFAQGNTQNFPTMKNANWTAMMQIAKAEYKELLTKAKRNDDATGLRTVWTRGHGLRTYNGTMPFPIDAAYIQGHLLNF